MTFLPADASARRYADIIIDAETGAVFHETNADIRIHPASLTKIMTLYIAFEELERGRLRLDRQLPVSSHAQRQPPSQLNLRKGQTISTRDAVLALVTKSANDAAVVVAEAIGGTETEFAKRMTAKARELGMSKTTFKNASGLYAKGQLSTARDMALLGQRIRKDFPEKYKYFSTKTFNYKGRTFRNHNKLLSGYEGTDGIKTGYIGASGFNLVASVRRNGRQLIGVVLGGSSGRSRDNQMKKLLSGSFRQIQLAAIRPPERPTALPVTIAGKTPESNPFEEVVTVAVADAVATDADMEAPDAADVEVGSYDDSIAGESLDSATSAIWGIQVGAFREKIRAQQAARVAAARIRPITSDARIMISTTTGDDGMTSLYQARLVGFNETDARDACRVIEHADLACVTVSPENLEAIALN